MNEMNRHSTTYNWLVEEKSPYLQQHAEQPVNWYAWGDVALAKAKRENKPILLSVGYSTCHWCHVMAHESFDDPQVAALLNEHFVAIKVDREERPDIDSIYMRACQMMTGQGGWPLNVFLTPEQLPFYAGTYFPKEAKYGRIGFVDLLEQLTEKFTVERERIESIGQHLQQQLAPKRLEKRTLSKHVLERTALQLKHSFDSIYGGFSQAPKFPLPHIPSFLLHYARWQNDETALAMATKTLDSMASGGLYDVIGGGFARYSVDEMWLVPHFEKMLYDNGLLLYTYGEAYQLTKKPQYMKIVQELVAFVERELLAENGTFYSALDADSDGAEGTYYIWKASELKALLTDEQYRFVETVFDVTEEGNFEGHNVLNSIHTNWPNVPYSEQEVAQLTTEVKAILFAARAKRTYPHRDEKVTTAWNGYVLAGLAKAYAVTERESYRALAERAFTTLEQTVWSDAWHVRYADGERSPHRFVDDQAAMLWAYVEWYRVTLDDRYLQGAERTAKALHTQFWDEEMGGFFLTSHDGEALIVREKELYDGALPSGNSVALYALWQLSYLTDEPSYRQLVETMWATFTTQVEQYGTGHTFFLKSYLLEQLAPQTVHVAATDEAFADVFEQSFERLAPEVFMTWATADEPMVNGKPTFYVCRNEQCFPPSNEWNESV